MRIRNSVSLAVRALAIATVALPVTVGFSDMALAQKFFSQQQIIQQLNTQPNGGQFVGQGQFQGRRVVKKRVVQPEFQGQIVVQEQFQVPKKFKRAPLPGNGGQFGNNGGTVVMKRVPMPQNQIDDEPIFVGENGGGKVKTFRAPMPENNGGTVVQEMRVPGVNENVARSRAPQPQNDDVIVASGGNDTQIRGIDVRPKKKAAKQVAVGQQVASAGGFDATGTNYPGHGRIDLEILFDYDSDRINPASVKQLIELGEALNDPSLGNGKFAIAGHTDATGSRFYNDDLSRRRAAAVTEFLVNYAGIDPRRLITEGYGEDLLKYPDAPESGQNRRVEIINLGNAG